ncbi:ribosome biogenesis protein Nop53/GLTSCR2 [Usnea florida]
MGQSREAPQQHKQPSRKGKKAWRKNVNVTDVQVGLEEAREEVIKGGIIAEKPSDSLFTLDTKGSEAIQKSYNKVHKPLKADQILAQRSSISAISGQKRHGVGDGVPEPSSKRRKNGVTTRDYERLRQVAYGSQTVKDIIKTDDTPDHDPWAPQPPEVENQDPRFSYLEKTRPIKAPATMKEAPISLLAGATNVPAVAAPNPGTSYNPTFQEWDAILTAEGQSEIEAEMKRRREADLEQERLDSIVSAAVERDADVQTEDESAWEGFESDYDGAEWLRKRRPERKTPAERNKVKRRKEAERREKWEKKMKEREKQQRQIGEIARQMKEEAKARALVKAELDKPKEMDDRVLRRRKLGKDTLPEPPLELVLPEELQDSLRLLKPEGNLLKDRFRNILISGKMETRKPIQQPKKKRVSYTEKWSYKDWTLAV